MKFILALVFAFATTSALAEDGTLNPHEGGIAQLRETLAQRPDRAGITCWVVYETQKGGLHGEALAALHDCARAGNAPSMILLSHAYENGLGTEASPQQATYWAQQAALEGYSVGQYHYGLALLNGHGVAKDAEQGRYWLEQAAQGGDENAAALLQTM